MTYSVKELFYTLQGEGRNAGRAAVFCRFSGCNLWSGREKDRASAVCTFCDTDFVGTDGGGGGRFHSAAALAAAAAEVWGGSGSGRRLIVLTGGEPLLQVDGDLVKTLHDTGFEIALETNGTIAAPNGIDWICVSPKTAPPYAISQGHELKLVYPNPRVRPQDVEHLAFEHLLLQPLDDSQRAQNAQDAIAHCMAHPQWRLSVQTHKNLGIR